MSKRYVTLGDGRTIGLGRYVAAWKQCLVLPPHTPIGRGISGSGDTAAEALRALRDGMMDRINRHDPRYGRGRKWSSDWFHSMLLAARALNNPRQRLYWLPAELMKIGRFRERLDSFGDVKMED